MHKYDWGYVIYILKNGKEMDWDNFLTRDKIKEIYEPMGFEHFKISGRGSHGEIVLYYAHYMVKPEYKEDFIALMMESICADNR